MRNFILFSLLIMAVGLQAQEVNKKQWMLINKKTADWCSLCGGYGWEMNKQLIDKFEKRNVMIWATHYSGGLINKAAVDISSNFGGSDRPIFFVNGVDIIVLPNNIAAKIADTQLEVDFTEDLPAFAGVGIEANLDSGTKKLNVNAKVEFLTFVEGGDYHLGLYLIEDNVIHNQASQGSMANHRYVLRQSILEDTWGKALVKGSVNEGAIFNVNVEVDNISAPREKLYIGAVIWNKVNNKYLFFNGNQVPVGISASSADVFTQINEMKVFQTEGENIMVNLEISEPLQNVTLSAIDISGKIISQKTFATLTEGKHALSLDGLYNSGVYFVRLSQNNKIKTKKLVIH